MTRTTRPLSRTHVVRVQATMILELTCVNCTREEAEASPFAHASKQRTEDIDDWEILSIESDT